MNAAQFTKCLGAEFYTGVPDSQLKALCNFLADQYGTASKQHIIAANEGNAAALAAGYHLATGKVPVVYLQNSGLGNIVNPVASLLNGKVYGIPCLFIVGWRGEPGVHDEPQHLFQGEITLGLLEKMEIPAFVIGPETDITQIQEISVEFQTLFRQGRQAAFVVRKGALEYEARGKFTNGNTILREEIITHILDHVGQDDVFISTTGMASRELFELREARGQDHARDFLTVGSMGHSSSIALGIALQKPERRVWCIDGDGAALMHMGAMPIIAAQSPANLIHVVINNQAHESVGGMPTVAGKVNWCALAQACGYTKTASVSDAIALDQSLKSFCAADGPAFLEVKAALGHRKDLGRPTTTPEQNKFSFMNFMNGKSTE